MKPFFKVMDRLLNKPEGVNLVLMNQLFKLGIPFNAPHGFNIKSLTPEEVRISLPNSKLNHNHLGGIHACAMATVGEFCAGVALIKVLGISNYRLILSELNVKYTYQGRKNLEGGCLMNQIDSEKIKTALNETESTFQKLTTVIRELDGREVAVVTSLWQLKAWDKVKTRPLSNGV